MVGKEMNLDSKGVYGCGGSHKFQPEYLEFTMLPEDGRLSSRARLVSSCLVTLLFTRRHTTSEIDYATASRLHQRFPS